MADEHMPSAKEDDTVMKKLGMALGAVICLIGLFYFVLMLTR